MKRRHRALLAGLLGLALSGPTLVARTPAAAPTFSPGPGTFTAPARVTLRTATAGAAIYYTTDGSNPSRQTSPTYAGPLTFDRTTTLKAFAYKKGFSNSPVVTGVYTVSATPPPPNESGGTLLLATLTPQSNATSGGSGFASLILTQDQTAAVLRYSYSGLTGPITSQHIHASDGTILFDLDTNPPQADGSRVWRIVAVGTYSKDAIVAAIRGGNCYLNLHTAAYPAGEIKGFFRPSNGSQTFTPPPAPPTLPPGPANGDDAARFLQQATFGPRPGEVEALQQKGFARWLDEQVALPRTSHLATYDQLVALTGDPRTQGLIQESFIAQAVQGQDQLRQRVTFALSELFVVSERDSDVRNLAAGTASYLDLLEKNAFGNFRQLLEDVTLSPTMGIYLDMAGSSKSIPEDERNPNENYPREILQLFTIGLYQLHPDGSLHLDAQSQPIPTYDQEVVKALARAFTGWTLGGQDHRFSQRFFRPVRNVRIPMEPWVQYHDTAEKALLDGAVLPAGQSATSDLEGALDVVFHHPNVGPFVCRALIQRLVSSNPSPAYVYRCAQTFANNGSGVRGDLNAVVRSILLDYEARAPQIATRPDAGHLREPFVRLVALLRAIDGRPRNGRWRFFAQLDRQGQSTGETPLRAPSVFNFFEPGYALPGEIAQAGLVSPEFQITTETTALGAANLNLTLITNAGRGAPLLVTLTPYQAPQVANDEALLDKVDLLFFAGGMSDSTRATLRNALADADFPRPSEQRILTLLWLASLAPESVVQK